MTAEATAIVVTNDNNPIKRDFLAILHQAALHNQLGYMDGMDPDTGEIVPLLVGVEHLEDGKMQLYPLAHAFLETDKLKNYLVPDGNGSYFCQNSLDAAGDLIAQLDTKPAKKQRRKTKQKADS